MTPPEVTVMNLRGIFADYTLFMEHTEPHIDLWHLDEFVAHIEGATLAECLVGVSEALKTHEGVRTRYREMAQAGLIVWTDDGGEA